MKKLYDKNELSFALLWIGVYVVLLSAADNYSKTLGVEKLLTAPVCIALTLILYLWLRRYDLKKKYGLCPFEAGLGKYLYFIPLVLLASTNLWGGLQINLTPWESVLHVICMLCVGFLEEVIFRGLLFQAICRTSVRQAIVISSITFGFGHIVNLLNGRDIPETLMQICYAAAIGFLFTVLVYRGKSLWPCIITHGVLNSLSAFANKSAMTMQSYLAACVFLCFVSISYALYIWKKQSPEAGLFS